MSKDKDTAVVDTKIPANVLEMSKIISGLITEKDGQLVIDPTAYAQTLPDDITIDDVKKVESHRAVFFPATTYAFGNASAKHLKSNKKVDEVNLIVPMNGHDTLSLEYLRSKEVRNPKTGEKSTKFGSVKAEFSMYAIRGDRGVMSEVRAELAAEATKLFGK